MDDFSWADSIRATMGSCLPCVAPNADSDDERGQNRTVGQNSAREELERLLDEPITDHEDVETMSLHSNVGRRAGKSRRKKPITRKSLRVFGIDLFGRRPVLPSEEDDENYEEYARGPRTRPRAISTSNLDEDAAPLDDVTLDFRTRAQERWAPSKTDEELAAEEALEQQRVEKEQRKAQRLQRKELKRLAELGAFNHAEGEEFEGFPGSGGGSVNGPEEFGPFVGVASLPQTNNGSAGGHTHVSSDDKDDEDVEFGAAEYMKKRRGQGGDGSRSGSGSHSRSRSRTSASISADGSQPRPQPPMTTSSGQGPKPQTPTRPRHKTTKEATSSNGRRSKSSITSSSVTQSLPSPTLLPSSDIKINTQEFDGKHYVHCCFHSPMQNPSGVPGGLFDGKDHASAINKPGFLSPSLSSSGFPSAGLPSTGFSNFKRAPSGLSGGAGVALARRGNE